MSVLDLHASGASPTARPGDADAAAGAARLARWLGLAAAPTFALMALATSLDTGPIAKICGAEAPLSGMAPMYLLMCALHAPPWLRLIVARGSGRRA